MGCLPFGLPCAQAPCLVAGQISCVAELLRVPLGTVLLLFRKKEGKGCKLKQRICESCYTKLVAVPGFLS